MNMNRNLVMALLSTVANLVALSGFAASIDSDIAVLTFDRIEPVRLARGSHPTSLEFAIRNFGPASLESVNAVPQRTSKVVLKVWLSRNQVFGDSDDVLFGQRELAIALPAGESLHQKLENVRDGLAWLTVPESASGTYSVFLETIHSPESALKDPDLSNNHALGVSVVTLELQVPAVPAIGGEKDGVLASGTYRVSSNLVVPAGKTLVIEPGTRLLFDNGI